MRRGEACIVATKRRRDRRAYPKVDLREDCFDDYATKWPLALEEPSSSLFPVYTPDGTKRGVYFPRAYVLVVDSTVHREDALA